MKIMASGDHHWDFTGPRFEECARVHDWMVGEAARRRPDVFLSGGDIYERASLPEERAAVAEWLTRMAEVCPVLITRGNHDAARDVELLQRLKTRHPVLVEERCGVHVIGGGVVAAVAWPSRAALATMIGKPLGTEGLEQAAQDALRAVFLGLRQELAPYAGFPTVLLGHFMIDGSVTSVGQPLVGCDFNVGLADLASVGAQMVIAGHIHAPQDWAHGGAPIVYTGSPYRTTFGEVETKSVVWAEIAPGAPVAWERLPTPARRMLLAEIRYAPDAALGFEGEIPIDVECAEVRIRYRVSAEHREIAKAAAAGLRWGMLEAGAVRVKVEEDVVATKVARAPEVARARTVAEKLDAWWAATRAEFAEGQRDRLLTKANELEAEDAA